MSVKVSWCRLRDAHFDHRPYVKAAETWFLLLSCLVDEAWTRRLAQVVKSSKLPPFSHRSATDKMCRWVTEGQQCASLQGSRWNYKNAMFPNVLAILHPHYSLVFYKYQALNNKGASTSPGILQPAPKWRNPLPLPRIFSRTLYGQLVHILKMDPRKKESLPHTHELSRWRVISTCPQRISRSSRRSFGTSTRIVSFYPKEFTST